MFYVKELSTSPSKPMLYKLVFLIFLSALLRVLYLNHASFQDSVGRVKQTFLQQVFEVQYVNNANGERPPIAPAYTSSSTEARSQLFISIGLCFNEGNSMKHKNETAYTAVASFSVSLWEHFTDARVMLWMVYREPKDPSLKSSLEASKKLFEESLSSTSALITWQPMADTETMSCATKSQMIRMFGFQHPEVKKDDIVLTSDVDAFVMSSDLILPLKNSSYKAWIFQYYHSVAMSGNEATFPMCFIALRSADWQRVVGNFSNPEELNKFMSGMLNVTGTDAVKSWYTDQWAATYGILKESICSLPETSTTWKKLKLHPSSQEDSSCWHGGPENGNCNIAGQLPRCLWWHFFPQETVADAKDTFVRIVGDRCKVTEQDGSPFYHVECFKNEKSSES